MRWRLGNYAQAFLLMIRAGVKPGLFRFPEKELDDVKTIPYNVGVRERRNMT